MFFQEQAMAGTNLVAAISCLVWALSSAQSQPPNTVPDHEIDRAIVSPRGALLCALVEDFYSYGRTMAYGPAQWGDISECCRGRRQSPRNLLTHSQSICGRLHGPHMSYNSSRRIMGELYNNGYDPTVHFNIPETAYLNHVPYTSGTYVIDNLHLHFCTSNPRGSEHAIDGRFYNGELHVVHYKESYGSVANAILHDDGLVVIAIMVQVVDPFNVNVNHELVELIKRMGQLQGVGKTFQIPVHVDPARIFPNSRAYLTYSGSLTSPPCSEAVQWIVLMEPIFISHHEMAILNRLPNNANGLISDTCNDRPLQVGDTIVETNLACATSLQTAAED